MRGAALGPSAGCRSYRASPGPVEPARYDGDCRAGVPGSGESVCSLDLTGPSPKGVGLLGGTARPRSPERGRSWAGAHFWPPVGRVRKGSARAKPRPRQSWGSDCRLPRAAGAAG